MMLTDRLHAVLFTLLLLLCACFAHSQSIAPFMGLGNAQFFDNNGQALTAGVLYSYQAGTTTQQATYTDATGLTLNPNPIPFGSGARVGIWLNASNYYKFVLCLQNDGAYCAASDVLFSVDQVPGSPRLVSTGSVFTGTFISGSTTPATSGILRLASGDAICWRNTANTANLCISKDSNDILEWAGGTLKMPEVACSGNSASFDYLCADSSTHHWKFTGNASSETIVPGIAAAGVAGDLVTLAANGIDITDSGISSTAPAFPLVIINGVTYGSFGTNSYVNGSVTSGTFTPGETVLQATSAATATLVSVSPSGPMWIVTASITGTPNSSSVWTGQTSGATFTPSIVPSYSAAPIAGQCQIALSATVAGWGSCASFNPPQRVVLSSSVTLPTNTQTIVLTETVTFPSTAGTYRADIRYGAWITAYYKTCAAEVIDTTNSLAFALNAQTTSSTDYGNAYIALSGSEVSTNTYAAGATATFTLQAQCNGTVHASVHSEFFTFSPAEATYLSVTPVLSN